MSAEIFHNGIHIASLRNPEDIFYAQLSGGLVAIRGESAGFSKLISWTEKNTLPKRILANRDESYGPNEMLQLDDGIVVAGENLPLRKSSAREL